MCDENIRSTIYRLEISKERQRPESAAIGERKMKKEEAKNFNAACREPSAVTIVCIYNLQN